jgi:hypothetical protein
MKMNNDIQQAIANADQLSDGELRETALSLLKATGYPYPDFLPSMDTSREALLDLIAGIAAIANAEVITVTEGKSSKGFG